MRDSGLLQRNDDCAVAAAYREQVGAFFLQGLAQRVDAIHAVTAHGDDGVTGAQADRGSGRTWFHRLDADAIRTVFEGSAGQSFAALVKGKIAASARLGRKIGPERVKNLAVRAGIQTELQDLPRMFLGESEVRLRQLLGQFAGEGVRHLGESGRAGEESQHDDDRRCKPSLPRVHAHSARQALKNPRFAP